MKLVILFEVDIIVLTVENEMYLFVYLTECKSTDLARIDCSPSFP